MGFLPGRGAVRRRNRKVAYDCPIFGTRQMPMKCVSKQALVFVAAFGLAAMLGACQQQAESPSKIESPPTSGAVSAAAGEVVHLAPYTQGSYAPLAGCNLDVINGSVAGASPLKMAASDINTFGGWIDVSGLAAAAIWLRFDADQGERHLQGPVRLTIDRPDVVAARPAAPLVSGFAVSIAAGALPAGNYHAYLAVQAGGVTYICDSGRHVEVQS